MFLLKIKVLNENLTKQKYRMKNILCKFLSFTDSVTIFEIPLKIINLKVKKSNRRISTNNCQFSRIEIEILSNFPSQNQLTRIFPQNQTEIP